MDNEKITKIGEFISELRKSKGMTQRDLAERLGVTDKAVSKWERGQSCPDISLIIPLSDLLGVTANELLRGESDIINSENIDEGGKSEDYEEKETESESSKSEVILSADADSEAENGNRKVEGDFTEIPAGTELSAGESTAAAEKVTKDCANLEKKKSITSEDIRNIILISLLGSVLIAIVVCMICDLAVNDRLNWSPIVIISCIAGWVLAVPVIKSRRRVVMKTLIALTAVTVPYLYLLFRTTYIWNIFAMGGPIYFVSIIGMWCMYATFLLLKDKKLYAAGVSFLIAAPVTILINNIAEYFTELNGWSNVINDFRKALVEVNPMDDIVNLIFMLILAAACFCTGYFLYHRESTR